MRAGRASRRAIQLPLQFRLLADRVVVDGQEREDMGHEEEFLPGHLARTRGRGSGSRLRQQWQETGDGQRRRHRASLGHKQRVSTTDANERPHGGSFERQI